jgi:hypothetical protein
MLVCLGSFGVGGACAGEPVCVCARARARGRVGGRRAVCGFVCVRARVYVEGGEGGGGYTFYVEGGGHEPCRA